MVTLSPFSWVAHLWIQSDRKYSEKNYICTEYVQSFPSFLSVFHKQSSIIPSIYLQYNIYITYIILGITSNLGPTGTQEGMHILCANVVPFYLKDWRIYEWTLVSMEVLEAVSLPPHKH